MAGILPEHGVPVSYHVLKGITHDGIYRQAFAEATRLELEWFATHLRSATKAEAKSP